MAHLPCVKFYPVMYESWNWNLNANENTMYTRKAGRKICYRKTKMQLDVDVSPPAISLLVDMNPKC